jgi:hypothetical protein
VHFAQVQCVEAVLEVLRVFQRFKEARLFQSTMQILQIFFIFIAKCTQLPTFSVSSGTATVNGSIFGLSFRSSPEPNHPRSGTCKTSSVAPNLLPTNTATIATETTTSPVNNLPIAVGKSSVTEVSTPDRLRVQLGQQYRIERKVIIIHCSLVVLHSNDTKLKLYLRCIVRTKLKTQSKYQPLKGHDRFLQP